MNWIAKRLDPLTRRRLRRFREMKRAWWSFCILGVAYVLSLGSELLCNEKPLYVRYNGESYFPIFQYYADDTFTGSGKQTRANYKEIARSEAFRSNPKNRMIFPPIPYGPYETLAASEIDLPDRVTVSIQPLRKVGNVNIDRDFRVTRSMQAAEFLGAEQEEYLAGQDVREIRPIGSDLENAIARRFENHDSPRFEVVLSPRRGAGTSETIVVLPAFAARPDPPETVRLTLRKPLAYDAKRHDLYFDRDGELAGGASPFWDAAPPAEKSHIRQRAMERFDQEIPAEFREIAGATCFVSFDRETVQFPFRPIYWSHPLGLDEAGRDVLARVLYAFRIAMSFGLLLVVIAMAAGVLIGAVQGYFVGIVDITGQRLIEIWSALPFLYIMILLGSVFGRSFILLLVVYGLFNWIGCSYYMRAEFLRLRTQQFVEAAKAIGVPTWKILFRHILPNALIPLVTLFPFSLVGAISSLTALDYLGFGMPPPTASWGELLYQAQVYRWAWWLIVYPAGALFFVMLLGVFVGEGLRNAFDPRDYAGVK